ncbi:MAG: ABC transporter substrate-binding protein [Desulfobacterales bacterium]|jgi:ABC-type branched-subunit amino acid transport system substrate-binding protein
MRKNIIWIVVAIVVSSLSFSLNAVAEEGVTDTEIHIGQWGPQTGPAAPWGAVARGTDAYFKMINAEGGIHGRKLVHHYFDDAYNPAKTMAGVKQLQEDVGIFAWVSGVGTSPGLAVESYLMERNIPWVSPSTGSAHWVDPPQKYLFALYPLYSGDAQVLVNYAVEKLGFEKIAITYQNDDYGKLGLVGAKKQMTRHGLKLAAEIPVNVADTDMKPHIMKLRQVKADAVLLFVTPGHVARLIGSGKAMKFEPQWMTTTTCADFPLMMYITKGLYAGTIAVNFGMLNPGQVGIGNVEDVNNPTLPLMKKYYNDVFKKYAAKEERWGMTFAAGIAYAEPLVKGLQLAGRDLTREKLVEKMESINNFQGIMGRVSYKPFQADEPLCRLGQKEVFLAQATEDGKYKVLTDWIQTEYVNYE